MRPSRTPVGSGFLVLPVHLRHAQFLRLTDGKCHLGAAHRAQLQYPASSRFMPALVISTGCSRAIRLPRIRLLLREYTNRVLTNE
jgi:hypothetical protein